MEIQSPNKKKKKTKEKQVRIEIKQRKYKQRTCFCPLFAHPWISAIKSSKKRKYLTSVIGRLLRYEHNELFPFLLKPKLIQKSFATTTELTSEIFCNYNKFELLAHLSVTGFLKRDLRYFGRVLSSAELLMTLLY